MLCPACFINQGITTSQGNLLPCSSCIDRQNKLDSPNLPVEIIPEYIKAERKERADSITQPHFKGEANKRYIDLWGEEVMRERGFSDKEIKNAKYVEDGLRSESQAVNYYKEQT